MREFIEKDTAAALEVSGHLNFPPLDYFQHFTYLFVNHETGQDFTTSS